MVHKIVYVCQFHVHLSKTLGGLEIVRLTFSLAEELTTQQQDNSSFFCNRIANQPGLRKYDKYPTLHGYCCIVNKEKVGPASPVGSITFGSPLEHLGSTSSMAAKYCGQSNLHAVTQSCPSPGISFIHTVQGAAQVSRITDVNSVHGLAKSSCKESMTSTALKDIHMPERLMENFLELARDNTSKDLETCGVLGASLKEGTFYISTLIIPKQESTSSSCQALNEEEIFAIQNELSHFPVGWIHTHPSQSCFMSSVDLHTQYSYQVMVPEAVAIVMAPTDKSRGYGVFRLSDPGGMTILKECPERGFHTHRELPDGSSVYEHCTNVYINPYLRLEICDLR